MAALKYADMGIRVIPMHSVAQGECSCNKKHCSSPGKHPVISKWVKAATTDEAQIRRWFSEYPFANVGIATGNDVVVIDIDRRNGGDSSLDSLCEKYGDDWLM